jgi:RNA polymerase Rpb1, domain 7
MGHIYDSLVLASIYVTM